MSNWNYSIDTIDTIIGNGDGSTCYYDFDGQYHREDGPAYIHFDGIEEWYYHGQLIECDNQEDFERLMKLKAFW